MNRYLLDTNHLSAYLDRQPTIEHRVDAALRAGDRFGIVLLTADTDFRPVHRLKIDNWL